MDPDARRAVTAIVLETWALAAAGRPFEYGKERAAPAVASDRVPKGLGAPAAPWGDGLRPEADPAAPPADADRAVSRGDRVVRFGRSGAYTITAPD